MEETKWLTKGKIVIIVVFLLVVVTIIGGILIYKSNLKKEYIKFEKQLEYAAPNYLIKEKIKLKEYEWREINISDILKQKLVINDKASDCKGYVIAEALKDNSIDLEEQANPIISGDEEQNSESNRISSNIKYSAYIKCKKIYITKGYGNKPDINKKNVEKTQTQEDTEKPTITLFGDEFINLYVGDSYSELGAVATDNIDGDITKKIKITGNVDTTKIGEYIIKYSVSDTAGNKTEIERKITITEKKEEKPIEKPIETPPSNNSVNKPVVDTISPIITFNDNSLYQTICTGNKANISVTGPYGYIARDNIDGIITSKVNISGDIDIINSPGIYKIYYRVSDNSGNNTEAVKQFTVKDCNSTIPTNNVSIPISSIRITPNNRTINISQIVQINVTIFPSNATDKNISYSSSNSSVATVSSDGIVTAISSGTSIIKATSSNGKIATCVINVN